MLTYSRSELLDIKSICANSKKLDVDCPIQSKPRKRGRKGGVRARAQRNGHRLSLPTVIFGNNNKIIISNGVLDFLHIHIHTTKLKYMEIKLQE